MRFVEVGREYISPDAIVGRRWNLRELSYKDSGCVMPTFLGPKDRIFATLRKSKLLLNRGFHFTTTKMRERRKRRGTCSQGYQRRVKKSFFYLHCAMPYFFCEKKVCKKAAGKRYSALFRVAMRIWCAGRSQHLQIEVDLFCRKILTFGRSG